MMRVVFITGTDTEVGKTHVACQLIRLLRQTGMKVGAYKPVCSGAVMSDDGHTRWDDVERLLDACGGRADSTLIAPQRFLAPLAPPVAASMEGRAVDELLLFSGLHAWHDSVDWLFVEGAGGLLSPLSLQSSLPDLMVEFPGPAIVVIANKLGCVNHTRLTVEALERRRIRIAALVLNETNPDESTDLSRQSNLDLLRNVLPAFELWTCGWNGQLQQCDGDARTAMTPETVISRLSPGS